jgi:hypothetical protein
MTERAEPSASEQITSEIARLKEFVEKENHDLAQFPTYRPAAAKGKLIGEAQTDLAWLKVLRANPDMNDEEVLILFQTKKNVT